jgi:hypothetical protein
MNNALKTAKRRDNLVVDTMKKSIKDKIDELENTTLTSD